MQLINLFVEMFIYLAKTCKCKILYYFLAIFLKYKGKINKIFFSLYRLIIKIIRLTNKFILINLLNFYIFINRKRLLYILLISIL